MANLWRERLNRWIEPVAKRCPFSPNTISAAALALNLCAAFLLWGGGVEARLFLVAGGVIALGGLLDGLDGAVARAQKKESPLGDFLDHLFDRISDAALVAGWTLGSGVRPPIALAALIAVTVDGYIGTQVEASFGHRTYEGTGRGEFVLALLVFPLVAYSLARAELLYVPFGGLSAPEWLTVAIAIVALLGIVQRFRIATRLGR
ncbi:MAG TPA: CDP-alcohol phosphatidyltransferase family protein [Thermoanaerobaculia bacterium]|nr:CDP-alcohol phosphatidyltransferase family protein [Thermoanaerobaculia bacterium]